MAEYIEREALIEKLNEAPAYFDSGDIRYGIDIATSEVIKQPIADVVKVVRCKDYKYWVEEKDLGMFCSHWGSTLAEAQAEDYCSYGELKECEG